MGHLGLMTRFCLVCILSAGLAPVSGVRFGHGTTATADPSGLTDELERNFTTCMAKYGPENDDIYKWWFSSTKRPPETMISSFAKHLQAAGCRRINVDPENKNAVPRTSGVLNDYIWREAMTVATEQYNTQKNKNLQLRSDEAKVDWDNENIDEGTKKVIQGEIES